MFWLIQTVYTIIPVVFIALGIISIALFKMSLDDVTHTLIYRSYCSQPSLSEAEQISTFSGKQAEESVIKEMS